MNCGVNGVAREAERPRVDLGPIIATAKGDGILIQTNLVRRFDVQLNPASVGQTITVTSAAPELQTDNATPTSELKAVQVQTIDTTAGYNMRNFQS